MVRNKQKSVREFASIPSAQINMQNKRNRDIELDLITDEPEPDYDERDGPVGHPDYSDTDESERHKDSDWSSDIEDEGISGSAEEGFDVTSDRRLSRARVRHRRSNAKVVINLNPQLTLRDARRVARELGVITNGESVPFNGN